MTDREEAALVVEQKIAERWLVDVEAEIVSLEQDASDGNRSEVDRVVARHRLLAAQQLRELLLVLIDRYDV